MHFPQHRYLFLNFCSLFCYFKNGIVELPVLLTYFSLIPPFSLACLLTPLFSWLLVLGIQSIPGAHSSRYKGNEGNEEER